MKISKEWETFFNYSALTIVCLIIIDAIFWYVHGIWLPKPVGPIYISFPAVLAYIFDLIAIIIGMIKAMSSEI